MATREEQARAILKMIDVAEERGELPDMLADADVAALLARPTRAEVEALLDDLIRDSESAGISEGAYDRRGARNERESAAETRRQILDLVCGPVDP